MTVKTKILRPSHKHIRTGDLRITENKTFRKLLTKGPNYRETKSINFSKAFFDHALEGRTEKISTKDKFKISNFK